MISVSSAFKDLVNSDNRNYIINATITLVDEDNTVLHITNENIWDNGVSFSEGTSSTSSFDVGSTVMSELTLVLNNIYNDFSGYDFFDATVEVRIGLMVNGEFEDFRKGFYTVEKPTYNGSLITLKCIDNMWKFEVPFDDIEITYPTTIGYIVGAICTHCGVLLEDANFRNKNFTIAEKPDEEMNCREVISHLAQICCCFAKITNDGKLRIRWYADDYADPEDDLDGGIFDNYSPYRTGDTADGGNFTDWSSGDNYDGGTFAEWSASINIRSISSVDICTDNIVVTGVKVSYSNKATDYVLNGQEGYVLKISGNPFIYNEIIAFEVATYLGLHLNGLTIRKYNISALNYPYVEAGDLCIIHDGRGNAFNSYVTNLTFTYGQYEMFSCGAEEPSRNNVVHYSEYAKTIAESKRNTQEVISEYDIAVQNMTQLAVNSMGYHQTVQTQADGSRITYLHDKPLLADSETIYKISIDGFFISTDGGETYSSGFDADGNVVVNILSAIGIKFDWAKGGILSLGGVDNGNGQIYIYDENGLNCGVINNTGFAMYSPTTQIQTIISPNIGLVMRDAGGNEYYGLSFSGEFNLPAYKSSQSYSASDTHFVFQDGTPYNGFTNQPIKGFFTDVMDVSGSGYCDLYSTRREDGSYGIVTYYYRYRTYFATPLYLRTCFSGWDKDYSKAMLKSNGSFTVSTSYTHTYAHMTSVYNTRVYYDYQARGLSANQSGGWSPIGTTLVVQLPEAFKGKNISATVTLLEPENPYVNDNESIAGYKNYYIYDGVFYDFSTATPVITGEYANVFMDTPNYYRGTAWNENIPSGYTTTTRISYTDLTDDERETYVLAKDFPFPDTYDSYDYSTVVDNENATITITGWAKGTIGTGTYPASVSMNEFMRFRVMAIC